MTDYKESEKEKELNELFQGNSNNHSFEKIVKKAKRRTILRNIVISIFVMVFLFITLGFSWLSIIRWSQENAMRDVELFSWITRPNVELLNAQNMGNGLFEGVLYFQRYKEVGGIPVDWSDDVVTYSLLGGARRLIGSPIQLSDKNDGQTRYYDRETKQRIMEFYHPEITYDHLRNDLPRLNDFSDEMLVEVALSFDQKYTPEQVRESIPDEITLKWYWADTYTDLERLKGKEIESADGETVNIVPAFPELDSEIYGFDEFSDDPSISVERFIDHIEAGVNVKGGKYFGEFERIYNYLKGESSALTADNVYVLGAVVTGTAAELTALEDLDMIRSSVFGVTVTPNK
jgi:Fe-S-cluster formation regulator IscX/YfhJ